MKDPFTVRPQQAVRAGEDCGVEGRSAVRIGWSLALLCVALALTGCPAPQPNDASVDSGPPAPIDASAFCSRVMAALDEDRCGYRGRCCTMFERDRIGPDGANWPVVWSCDQPLADRVATCTAALSGSSSYDPQQGAQCAIAIEAQETSPLCNGPDRYYGVPLPEETSPSCACLTAGVVDGGSSGCLSSEPPIGAPCGRNEDCAHDAYCAGSADGGMGSCRYRQQNGETCPADGIGAMGAPGCRSEYCIQGICTPFCIGVR